MTTHFLDNMIASTVKLIFFKVVTLLKEKGRDESKLLFIYFFYLVFAFIEDSESFQTRPSCLR